MADDAGSRQATGDGEPARPPATNPCAARSVRPSCTLPRAVDRRFRHRRRIQPPLLSVCRGARSPPIGRWPYRRLLIGHFDRTSSVTALGHGPCQGRRSLSRPHRVHGRRRQRAPRGRSACSTQAPPGDTRTGLSRAWWSSGTSSASRPTRSSRSSTATTSTPSAASALGRPRRRDQLGGIEVGEGQAARRAVGDRVGEGAAEAEGDDRAEGGVRLDGGARLHPAGHHALHDGLGHRRAERRGHALVRAPQLLGVLDVEGDAAALGPGQAHEAAGLQGDRVAELLGRRQRRRRALVTPRAGATGMP